MALPGPALTVSVTFGFEQKKVRKAQSSEASSPAARRRVLLEHRFGRRFALDPLDFADLEAVLLQQGDRHVERVAGHVRDLGASCRGSGRSRPGAPISTAAATSDPAAGGGAALLLFDRVHPSASSGVGDDRRQRREGGGAAAGSSPGP